VLGQQGKTVLITTNYLEESPGIVQPDAIIDHGRLVALDTPEKFKEALRRKCVGNGNGPPLEMLKNCAQCLV